MQFGPISSDMLHLCIVVISVYVAVLLGRFIKKIFFIYMVDIIKNIWNFINKKGDSI